MSRNFHRDVGQRGDVVTYAKDAYRDFKSLSPFVALNTAAAITSAADLYRRIKQGSSTSHLVGPAAYTVANLVAAGLTAHQSTQKYRGHTYVRNSSSDESTRNTTLPNFGLFHRSWMPRTANGARRSRPRSNVRGRANKSTATRSSHVPLVDPFPRKFGPRFVGQGPRL